MRILILGAEEGMLGTRLVRAFENGDCREVIGWDKDVVDLRQFSFVQEAICDLHPTLIINAAAFTNVDGCEKDFELAYAVNGVAVGAIASAAKKIGATLIHYSTDYVFSGQCASGYLETTVANPLSAYGKSKFLGEILLERSGLEHYAIIRTSWLFGPVSSKGSNFVTKIVAAAKENPQLTVVNDQFGCPTYTVDLAQATRKIVEAGLSHHVYHTTNLGFCSWYDFAREIVRILELPNEVVPTTTAKYMKEHPKAAKRPMYSVLLNTHGPLLRPWQEALAEYLTPEVRQL